MAALPNTCGYAVVNIPKTETLAITKHLLSEHKDVTLDLRWKFVRVCTEWNWQSQVMVQEILAGSGPEGKRVRLC